MSKVLKVKVTPPWIPVTKKLPEMYEYVLVYYPNSQAYSKITVDWMMTNEKFTLDDSTDTDVFFGAPTHWMPIPEPPEVD